MVNHLECSLRTLLRDTLAVGISTANDCFALAPWAVYRSGNILVRLHPSLGFSII